MGNPIHIKETIINVCELLSHARSPIDNERELKRLEINKDVIRVCDLPPKGSSLKTKSHGEKWREVYN